MSLPGGNCRHCGAVIKFVSSAKSGKPMPLEAKPMTVVTEDGVVHTNARESHFAYCQGAAEARARKPATPPKEWGTGQ